MRVGRSFRVPEEAVNDYIRRSTEPATPDVKDVQDVHDKDQDQDDTTTDSPAPGPARPDQP